MSLFKEKFWVLEKKVISLQTFFKNKRNKKKNRKKITSISTK